MAEGKGLKKIPPFWGGIISSGSVVVLVFHSTGCLRFCFHGFGIKTGKRIKKRKLTDTD
jgi:succinate dehydrogenase/fumarate reductase cytochrome b subunit